MFVHNECVLKVLLQVYLCSLLYVSQQESGLVCMKQIKWCHANVSVNTPDFFFFSPTFTSS